MKLITMLTLASITLVLSCTRDTYKGTTVMTQNQKVNITKIKLLLPGKMPVRDDNLLATITDKKQIQAIMEFADNQLVEASKWRPEWNGVSVAPAPFINLKFYELDDYKRDFGVSDTIFSTHDDNGYRVKTATGEERQQFLKLIGVTEKEYAELKIKLYEPGPWKK